MKKINYNKIAEDAVRTLKYKEIRKWGSSYVIVLSPKDMKAHGWKLGDILDIQDVVKARK